MAPDPDIEYLFWVGCAGALEGRAEKTTKAVATLLHNAEVKSAVLGPAETVSRAGDGRLAIPRT